eukprot:COSAG02_NODE_11752_length_1661_cov_32.720230_1_plen_133_part_00
MGHAWVEAPGAGRHARARGSRATDCVARCTACRAVLLGAPQTSTPVASSLARPGLGGSAKGCCRYLVAATGEPGMSFQRLFGKRKEPESAADALRRVQEADALRRVQEAESEPEGALEADPGAMLQKQFSDA